MTSPISVSIPPAPAQRPVKLTASPGAAAEGEAAARSPWIALALSGGGVRAMAFHAGVLRYLAEQRKLEAVSQISTVSGASLLLGLIFARNDMRWPASEEYAGYVLPQLRATLTSQDLQMAMLKRLLTRPSNWQYLFSRANVFAQTIAETWGIHQTLGELPSSPEWAINGATAETGKRFRFLGAHLGDYELGYATTPGFAMAKAMAMSAAFPIGIGPLALRMDEHEWRKQSSWNAPETVQNYAPPYELIHVYDGGIYDNLGLEPFYDIGKRASKGDFCIIASDASAPLEKGFEMRALSPLRVKRIIEVVSAQTRALRVRAFMEFLIQGGDGAYLPIGGNPRHLLKRSKNPIADEGYTWLSPAEIEQSSAYPTNLRSISPQMFDLLERHGYEMCKARQLVFGFLPETQNVLTESP
ncbi:patatin-like phospholipase family protein [Massilia sp. W12]|uniref:patatin-like phospholipase family protein n=1 Tax=Massilia sp. W12 TaxID=3126507 RepID=UPI0030D54483